ncbi:stage V sporulation protein D [Clostridium perfringens]|uniref:Stage V sporulation protein D n=1 Tax=Clostridium perfringens (strain ATCC 13124 / DSM 756 / JCM 1290 / NCIMB 6125 / NCTC 8237 / Type A) TaxID=195103 RepID=A0A0H2YRJ8_CLOP1|nr:stage V sporulation protein D [Clostridium perfringens]ABG83556.1 stage V sporulation protein D [Clostridium perfringens ATCC 13124]ELC8340680.1 stage V sporulation protein D [Clostridium perfringens]ELC8398565.1 stage V sporulation protein D [Clostridium perfringens]ELC8452128.1 stage V sporulation protein D [Clostridium perfringens]MDK0532168.1 stage V sporulation protein D [Clostridium perfringens]
MKAKKKNKKIKLNEGRVLAFLLAIVILFLALSGRLLYISIFRSKDYKAMAEEQWTNEIQIDARRGRILDRNNRELAVTANVFRVDLDLITLRKYIDKKDTDNIEIAKLLAEALEMDEEKVLSRIELTYPSGNPANSATLIRRIEKEKADKVKELDINGVIVSEDTKRYYPNGDFLSHTLGTTNADGEGLSGLELYYNEELMGIPGVRVSEVSGNSTSNPYSETSFTPPVDGKDMTLTIDENIQYFVEKVAEDALKKHNADSVSIAVMNPNNGEILGMVNKPGFNPNNPYEGSEAFKGKDESAKLQNMWRNTIVSDAFEPGSIFKIITSIAAIEENIAGKDEVYYCDGSLNVAGKNIKCWKPGGHGVQNFNQTLENSCNVAFMEMGAKLGAEKLNEYIKLFGFGTQSGIDLPGEATGIVKNVEDISAVDLATISFGQTNTMNGIQFMTALNAVANGGDLIQPHIMKELSHKDDNGTKIIDEVFVPKIQENIVDEKSTMRVKEALESTVSNGSSKDAGIEGIKVAGKTGTAEKVDPETGTYGAGYIASFAGFAPYDNPQVSLIVIIDNPKNGEHFGGIVAAPFAGELFNNIFNYISLNEGQLDAKDESVIIPDLRGDKVTSAEKTLNELGVNCVIEGDGTFVTSVTPIPGYKVKKGDSITLYAGSRFDRNEKEIVVPDFRKLNKEEAEEILKSLGLKGEFEGEGEIKEQSISAGEIIKSGDKIKFKLEG